MNVEQVVSSDSTAKELNTNVVSVDTAAKPEVAVETKEVQPSEESQSIAKNLALMAKREKAMRDKELQWKQDLENKDKSLAELKLKAEKLDKIAAKDYSTLEELGLDYNDYTEYKLGGGKLTQQQFAEKLTKDLEGKFEARIAAKEKELSTKAEQAAKAQEAAQALRERSYIKDQIEDLEKDGKKYPFLRKQAEYDTVLRDIIYEHKKRTTLVDDDGNTLKEGRILSVSEAAEMADKYYKTELSNTLKAEEVKSLFLELHPELATLVADLEKKAQEKAAKAPKDKDAGPSTITNNLTVQKSGEEKPEGLKGQALIEWSKKRALEKAAQRKAAQK